MTRKAFEAMNRQQEQTGGKIFVNARNSAGGIGARAGPFDYGTTKAGLLCVLFACWR